MHRDVHHATLTTPSERRQFVLAFRFLAEQLLLGDFAIYATTERALEMSKPGGDQWLLVRWQGEGGASLLDWRYSKQQEHTTTPRLTPTPTPTPKPVS